MRQERRGLCAANDLRVHAGCTERRREHLRGDTVDQSVEPVLVRATIDAEGHLDRLMAGEPLRLGGCRAAGNDQINVGHPQTVKIQDALGCLSGDASTAEIPRQTERRLGWHEQQGPIWIRVASPRAGIAGYWHVGLA
jgi:hypothetical protein